MVTGALAAYCWQLDKMPDRRQYKYIDGGMRGKLNLVWWDLVLSSIVACNGFFNLPVPC